MPSDEGATPVRGYKVYLDSALHYDGSTQSTLNTYTFVNLNVGQTYKMGVTAGNDIGEGAVSELTLLSASVPSKVKVPGLVASTGT